MDDVLAEIDRAITAMDPPGQRFECACPVFDGERGYSEDCWHANRTWPWPSENSVVIPILSSGPRGHHQSIIRLKPLDEGFVDSWRWFPASKMQWHSSASLASKFGLKRYEHHDGYPF